MNAVELDNDIYDYSGKTKRLMVKMLNKKSGKEEWLEIEFHQIQTTLQIKNDEEDIPTGSLGGWVTLGCKLADCSVWIDEDTYIVDSHISGSGCISNSLIFHSHITMEDASIDMCKLVYAKGILEPNSTWMSDYRVESPFIIEEDMTVEGTNHYEREKDHWFKDIP